MVMSLLLLEQEEPVERGLKLTIRTEMMERQEEQVHLVLLHIQSKLAAEE
jgi:hypothetical protein